MHLRGTWTTWALLLVALAGCLQPGAAPPPLTLACEAACAFTLATSDAYAWEPHAAADPHDADHLVAAVALLRGGPAPDAFANDLLVAVTRDGGATWAQTTIPHGPGAGPGHPLAGSRALADPNVAFLPDGTTLVSGLAYNLVAGPAGGVAQGFRIFVARSSDGGATFPEVSVVTSDEGVASITPLGHRAAGLNAPDAPTMAVAPDGSVHLTWRAMRQTTPAGPERSVMMAARSMDGARTWSQPVVIDTGGVNAVASQLVATRDGILLAAVGGWNEGGVTEATRGSQMLARSTDLGATWQVDVIAEEFVPGIAWWPTLADSAAGIVFAYPKADGEGRESVVAHLSTDRGESFGAPIELARANASGHAMPTLGGDGTTAFLTWFAPQEDGATRNELRALALREGNASAAIVLDATLTVDATQLGEYFGIAVAGGRAMPVWTNNEEGGRLMGAWLRATPS